MEICTRDDNCLDPAYRTKIALEYPEVRDPGIAQRISSVSRTTPATKTLRLPSQASTKQVPVPSHAQPRPPAKPPSRAPKPSRCLSPAKHQPSKTLVPVPSQAESP